MMETKALDFPLYTSRGRSTYIIFSFCPCLCLCCRVIRHLKRCQGTLSSVPMLFYWLYGSGQMQAHESMHRFGPSTVWSTLYPVGSYDPLTRRPTLLAQVAAVQRTAKWAMGSRMKSTADSLTSLKPLITLWRDHQVANTLVISLQWPQAHPFPASLVSYRQNARMIDVLPFTHRYEMVAWPVMRSAMQDKISGRANQPKLVRHCHNLTSFASH